MFWDNYLQLCVEREKSPTSVGLELGFSRATVSNWKNGGVPRETALLKIASYFNVTPDYLLGRTDQKEKPSEEGEDVVVVSRNGERFVHHLNPDQIKLLEDMIKQFGGDN